MAGRIRIRLKAFDHWVVDQTASDIVRTAEKTGATVKGPVPLPTRRARWTVLKGPHIDKKSREQFELRTASGMDKPLVVLELLPDAWPKDLLGPVEPLDLDQPRHRLRLVSVQGDGKVVDVGIQPVPQVPGSPAIAPVHLAPRGLGVQGSRPGPAQAMIMTTASLCTTRASLAAPQWG